MKKIFSGLLVAALLLCLTACGSNSVAKYETMAAGTMVEEAAPMAPAMMTDNSASFKGAGNQSPTLPEGRKWIITIDMNVETDDLDTLIADLDQTITGLGGYVENQSMHNGSTYAARRYRSASLTVRIPEEKADQFTGDLSGMANVVSRNLRREDITLQYVATSGRVTALETEEARLLELLAQAETMADLLEIEARLTDVRYELENYASRLRALDNMVSYATVNLFIRQVKVYTEVEPQSVWQRIGSGFRENLVDIGEDLTDFFVWLVTYSPQLIFWALVGFAGIKLLGRKLKKRKVSKVPMEKPEKEE